MPKVIIFGSTGKAGLAIINHALQNTDNVVSVYVRRPKRLPSHLKSKLNIIVGDVLDADAVNDALKEQDLVLSSLGPGWNLKPMTVMSDGIKNIVNGMRNNGIKKLICIGVSFLLKEPDREAFKFLQHVVADHKRAIEFLSEVTDVDWIVMMPPRILGRSHVSEYRTAVDRLDGPDKVTTADIADFMFSCAGDEAKFAEYNHKLVGISSFLTCFQAFCCCGCA